MKESDTSIASIFVESCLFNYIESNFDEDYLEILCNPKLLVESDDSGNFLNIDLNQLQPNGSSFHLNRTPAFNVNTNSNSDKNSAKIDELTNKLVDLKNKNRTLNGFGEEDKEILKKDIQKIISGKKPIDQLVELNNMIVKIEEDNKNAETSNKNLNNKINSVKNTAENISSDSSEQNNSTHKNKRKIRINRISGKGRRIESAPSPQPQANRGSAPSPQPQANRGSE